MDNQGKGQTTYKINNIIELLFTQPDSEIVVQDHFLRENHRQRLDEYKVKNKELVDKVIARLKLEHDREVSVREEGDNYLIKLV